MTGAGSLINAGKLVYANNVSILGHVIEDILIKFEAGHL